MGGLSSSYSLVEIIQNDSVPYVPQILSEFSAKVELY